MIIKKLLTVLTAFKPIKFNFVLQTWDILLFVGRLRKKQIIFRRTLAKSVENTKVQKQNTQSQRGFILPTLYKKTPDRSLYLRLPYY